MINGPTPIYSNLPEQFSAMRVNILAFMNSLPAHISPTRRDLILGFATGYKPHMIAPFVESVRVHGRFSGKVVLFVDPGARKMADYLRSHDIEAIPFDSSKSPIATILVARFFAYFEYLRKQFDCGAVFDQILLTDVRDVIFQRPLFEKPCEELEFHLEGTTITTDESDFTSRWVEIACGKEAVQALSSKPAYCAGTICGRALGIFDYLAQMQLLALGLSEGARSTWWGVDQGLHNYIFYMGLTRAAVSKPNFARVATLGAVPGNTLVCDLKGRIINPTGDISEIAHHWDRHRHLAKRICAVYLMSSQYGRWRSWTARTLPVLTLSTWRHLLRLANIGLARVGSK
jgi:hypothetical protein